MSVAQIVQADHGRRSLGEIPAAACLHLRETAGEPLRVPDTAFVISERHRGVTGVRQRHAPPLPAMGAQHGHGRVVQVDNPWPACLGRPLDYSRALPGGAEHPSRPADRNRPGVQVDVTPAQRQQFPAAHPGHGEHRPRRVKLSVVVSGPVQERSQLAGGPRVHLRRPGLPR